MEHPQKLEALIKAWFEEAEKNLVLPLDDRSAMELFAAWIPGATAERRGARRTEGEVLNEHGHRRRPEG